MGRKEGRRRGEEGGENTRTGGECLCPGVGGKAPGRTPRGPRPPPGWGGLPAGAPARLIPVVPPRGPCLQLAGGGLGQDPAGLRAPRVRQLLRAPGLAPSRLGRCRAGVPGPEAAAGVRWSRLFWDGVTVPPTARRRPWWPGARARGLLPSASEGPLAVGPVPRDASGPPTPSGHLRQGALSGYRRRGLGLQGTRLSPRRGLPLPPGPRAASAFLAGQRLRGGVPAAPLAPVDGPHGGGGCGPPRGATRAGALAGAFHLAPPHGQPPAGPRPRRRRRFRAGRHPLPGAGRARARGASAGLSATRGGALAG